MFLSYWYCRKARHLKNVTAAVRDFATTTHANQDHVHRGDVTYRGTLMIQYVTIQGDGSHWGTSHTQSS